MNFFWNLKLIYKMLIIYIVAFLIMIITSLFFFNYYVSIIKKESIRYSEELTQQIGINIEQHFNHMTAEMFGTYNLSMLLSKNMSIPLSNGEKSDFDNRMRGYAIKKALDEFLYSTSFTNWIGAVDRYGLTYYTSKSALTERYDLSLHADRDQAACVSASGDVLWRKMENGTICLSRMIYDMDKMQYTGYVIVNVDLQAFLPIVEKLESLDGMSMIIYDSFDQPMFYYLEDNLSLPDLSLQPFSQLNFNELAKERTFFSESLITKSNLPFIKLTDLTIITKKVNEISTLFTISILICMLSISCITALVLSPINQNIRIVLSGIRLLGKGQLNVKIQPVCHDEIGEIAQQFNEMTSRMQGLIQQIEKEAALRREMDYRLLELKYHSLQTQINPHFMFNALESINGIAKINNDLPTSNLILKLSHLLRDNLERSGNTSPLEEEIKHAINFLQLYCDIYLGKLSIQLDHPSDLDDVEVPTFTLLPIVENAVVHGIAQKVGAGIVRIQTKIQDENLLISVFDDGVGIAPAQLKELLTAEHSNKHIGLKNVDHRIKILYGSSYGVHIDSQPGVYTEIVITLPI